MAKPHRYPKKFRMKLEKIAEQRQQREAEAAIADNPVFRTYYQDFLSPGSVHVMHSRLDEAEDNAGFPRLTTRYHLRPQRVVASVSIDPPWQPKPAS